MNRFMSPDEYLNVVVALFGIGTVLATIGATMLFGIGGALISLGTACIIWSKA